MQTSRTLRANRTHLGKTCLLIALCGTAGVALLPQEAQAQTVLSVDLDYAAPIDQTGVDSGGGAQVRFGPRLDLALVQIDGEVGLGLHTFSGTLSPTAYRGVVGGRLGFDFLLRPSIYTHAGVGHVNFSRGSNLTHFTWDGGLALDFSVIPLLDVGAHVGYNIILGNSDVSAFGYMVAGLHASLLF